MEDRVREMAESAESLGRSCAPFFLASVALLLGFLVYFYAPYWRVRRVPGPPTTFPVGHIHLLGKHGPDILRVFAKKYGPIFRFHFGRQPLVIVADAELCREVGIKNFKDTMNRSNLSPTLTTPIFLKGLLLARDSRWTSTRNLVTSLYQPSHLASLIPTVHHYVTSFCHTISTFQRNREDVPFSELSLRFTTTVICKTAFGIEFGFLNDDSSGCRNDDDDDGSCFLQQQIYSAKALKMDLSGSLSTTLGMIAPVLQKPCREIFKRIPGAADYKLHQINQRLCESMDAIIAKRSIEMTRESKDFLAALLKARDTRLNGNLLTDNHVRTLAVEHLFAGTITMAFTLSMTVYLVSQHPEVEKKLVEEIDRFGPRDRIPTSDDLHSKFPYLDQVIKESLRMYTVAPLVARETSQQIEIGGYVLPKDQLAHPARELTVATFAQGTCVWLALGVVAKDPEQFPEPDVFRPERFDPAGDEEKRRHPYAHIPFGIGPRECIAQKFAIQELKLTLFQLYQHYVFRLSPKMEFPPEFQYSVILWFKRDIMLRAIKRAND
ncbi:cytochrome P450 [Musa troglodytarum]|uniref:Cytochrome P450 n=1 Tax=Musa troglodytarum TaxID=320322 RepID=A0A9E7GYZ1_9LILI|nr:cytochrome P450 [Musa troglodytarum]